MPRAAVSQAIEGALADARRQGVSGKDVTPVLLAAVVRLTGGESLKSNIQLVYNNVRLAARVAAWYGCEMSAF